jgi:hypothetical protein
LYLYQSFRKFKISTDLYFSQNIIRVIKSRNGMGGVCSKYGGEERSIPGFGGETSGNRRLERPGRRWKDDIKGDIQEVGWGMDWIDLAHDRDGWWIVVNMVINFRVP